MSRLDGETLLTSQAEVWQYVDDGVPSRTIEQSRVHATRKMQEQNYGSESTDFGVHPAFRRI